ncbi:MAG TPA: NTP transferase domain-containing protein [Oligoflexus sp.]|uniref:NTP transferase domain-containing protein n=1 Tax=Oligoflexus sp. TaxID=1971216 RepID=UPI002D397501|nr:NTP transferase domain-containing protein [Oligoflexus sp.]HYX39298.1 NTP transferase domain-containing protein [Oligoflexus sp.]
MRAESRQFAAIVLAAGKGTRMKSQLPKVLHPLAGVPMVGRVLSTLNSIGIHDICAVIGGELDQLSACLENYQPLTLTVQTDRLGTGEAVACAGFGFNNTQIPSYAKGYWWSGGKLDCTHVLICAGDTPALDGQVLRSFLDSCQSKGSRLAVLAMRHPQPRGYGRILMNDQGQLQGIVEEKDATATEKKIEICNSGVIFAEKDLLFSLLGQLTTANAQKEYYLTDCFALARKQNIGADVWVTDHYEAFDGINDRRQLADLEQRILRRIRENWMLAGVTFQMADSCYIEESVLIGEDARIGPHCTLLGRTRIGKSCEIGSHVCLKDVIIPDGTKVPSGTIQSSTTAS